MDGKTENSPINHSNEGKRQAYIQSPWDFEVDRDRTMSLNDVVGKLRSAAVAPPAERLSQQTIDGYMDEFVTHQDVLEKALDKWHKDEDRSHSAEHPQHQLITYIEAATTLGDRAGNVEQYLGFTMPLLGRYLDYFVQELNQNQDSADIFDQHAAVQGLNAISLYAAYGKDEVTKTKATTLLLDNLDFVDRQLQVNERGFVNNNRVFPALMQIHQFGATDQRERVSGIVNRVLSLPNTLALELDMFDPNESSYVPYLRLLEEDFLNIVEESMKTHGLNTDKILSEWRIIPGMSNVALENRMKRFKKAIPASMRNIKELDEANLGRARVLQERFGINHFGRYPAELLIRQYTERGDFTKPYGVILGAVDDYNEASVGSIEAYSELLSALGGRFSIRAVECDSKYGSNGIEGQFANFDQAYFRNGEGHKIGFLVINGHGNVEGTKLWFGAKGNRHGVISMRDLRRAKRHGVRDYFVDTPDVIYVSCDVGKVLARETSEALQARVVANTQPVNSIKHFHPGLEGDRLLLDPEYADFGAKGKILFIDGVEQVA